MRSVRSTLRKAAVGGAIALVSAILVCACLIGGLGFALAAFYLHLSATAPAASAAFATAGVAVACAIVIGVIAALAMRIVGREPAPQVRPSPSAGPRAEAKGELPSALVGAVDWIADNPKSAGIGALAAGVVIGMFPELRKGLSDALSVALRPPRRD